MPARPLKDVGNGWGTSAAVAAAEHVNAATLTRDRRDGLPKVMLMLTGARRRLLLESSHHSIPVQSMSLSSASAPPSWPHTRCLSLKRARHAR